MFELMFKNLPLDIVKYILLFSPITSPSGGPIKRVIKCYEEDHCYYLTKKYRKYFIQNIISFSDYYFHSRQVPNEYELGPYSYDINYEYSTLREDIKQEEEYEIERMEYELKLLEAKYAKPA